MVKRSNIRTGSCMQSISGFWHFCLFCYLLTQIIWRAETSSCYKRPRDHETSICQGSHKLCQSWGKSYLQSYDIETKNLQLQKFSKHFLKYSMYFYSLLYRVIRGTLTYDSDVLLKRGHACDYEYWPLVSFYLWGPQCGFREPKIGVK